MMRALAAAMCGLFLSVFSPRPPQQQQASRPVDPANRGLGAPASWR